MIPLRLELKNFMSYGEDVPVLDFAGMHMVCLSGDNGNGKSALLDAMTWSLWGESRAGKNKHDDLVRIGADEMSVQFTFAMDGQTYRVLRKRSKRASGNVWELQQESDENNWRSLTGNNAGETERQIQKLLRMSYDTFLNSAYLRQGQSDQFVKQPPGKRKEILADILDLSRYDKLEAKAREKMRDAAVEATDLERDINQIDAELAGEEGHRASLTDLQERFEALRGQYETLKAEWETRQERRSQLIAQKQSADTLASQIKALDGEISALDADLAASQADAEGCRILLSRGEDICRRYDELLALRGRMEQLESDLSRWNKGQQMLMEARRAWDAARHEVQRALDRAVREHEDALKRLQDYPLLRADFDRLARAVAEAKAQEAERDRLQVLLDGERDARSTLEQDHARLNEQLRQWDERLAALAQQQGNCIVCDTPLPPAKIASTRVEYEAERETVGARRNEVRAEGASVKKEIAALEAQTKALDAEIRGGQKERERYVLIQQRLFELDEIQKDLPNLAAVRAQAQTALDAGQFAPELKAKIADYEGRLAKMATIEADHVEARARLTLLAPVEREQLELTQAQANLTRLEKRIAQDTQARGSRQASRAAADAQWRQIADVSAELAALEARGVEIRALEQQRMVDEKAVSREIAASESALMRCEGLKTIRTEKAKQFSIAKQEQEVHKQLADAFGKKGVQALIIENAVPELQEEANRLLERLTDGDMSLYFDTLREAKSKKDQTIETLDIKVSDNLGTRPLEMYSGGEGFRAAFALRIALSKLLTRRAGAKLQTLIIDEGFGTQDGKGREKLVDALNAIKDDFERIIVITHIDELKDAFATRVEVVKTPSGSQITVMEGAAG